MVQLKPAVVTQPADRDLQPEGRSGDHVLADAWQVDDVIDLADERGKQDLVLEVTSCRRSGNEVTVVPGFFEAHHLSISREARLLQSVVAQADPGGAALRCGVWWTNCTPDCSPTYTVAPRSRSRLAMTVTAAGCVVAGYGFGELHTGLRSTRSPGVSQEKLVAACAASRMAPSRAPEAACRGTPTMATRAGGRRRQRLDRRDRCADAGRPVVRRRRPPRKDAPARRCLEGRLHPGGTWQAVLHRRSLRSALELRSLVSAPLRFRLRSPSR